MYIYIYRGYIGANGKENGNYYNQSWGYIGIMEKKMETTVIWVT